MATSTTIPRYSPSGFFRPTTFALFIGAAVAALPVAFIYQLAMHWVPRLSIYLSAIICGSFGFGLGSAAVWAIKTGHCRNRLIALALVLPLTAGLVGGSFYWAYNTFISEVTENVREKTPDVTPAQVRAELPFSKFIDLRVENGWQMTDHGRDGAKFDGAVVWVIWGIEAMILFGIAVTMAYKAVSAPYCERCNQWGTERKMLLRGLNRGDANGPLQSGDLDAVIGLPLPADPNLSVALALTATLCPQCKDTGFLTVEEKLVVAKKKGKPQEKSTALITNAILRADQRARFLERLEPSTVSPPTATPPLL